MRGRTKGGRLKKGWWLSPCDGKVHRRGSSSGRRVTRAARSRSSSSSRRQARPVVTFRTMPSGWHRARGVDALAAARPLELALGQDGQGAFLEVPPTGFDRARSRLEAAGFRVRKVKA